MKPGKTFEPTYAQPPPDYNDLDVQGEFDGSFAKRVKVFGKSFNVCCKNKESERNIQFGGTYIPDNPVKPKRFSNGKI